MKRHIISFNKNNTTYYVRNPYWYRIHYGRGEKRLGYFLTTYKDLAHKFIKRRNVRVIMNDIALRHKKNPIMTRIN